MPWKNWKNVQKSISWGRLEAGVNLILIKFYHSLKMQGLKDNFLLRSGEKSHNKNRLQLIIKISKLNENQICDTHKIQMSSEHKNDNIKLVVRLSLNKLYYVCFVCQLGI